MVWKRVERVLREDLVEVLEMVRNVLSEADGFLGGLRVFVKGFRESLRGSTGCSDVLGRGCQPSSEDTISVLECILWDRS